MEGLRSSLTATSRPKREGSFKSNLNTFVKSLKQENIKRLLDEPQKLMRTIEECRKTILQMESVINEQNTELEMSVRALEEKDEHHLNNTQQIRSL